MEFTTYNPKTAEAKIAFDTATEIFASQPSAGTKALLNIAMLAMMPTVPAIRFATSSGNDKHWQAPVNGTDFIGLRITTDRRLTDAEVTPATDAINYAMKIYVGMPPLEAPRVTHGDRYSIIEFDTNTTRGNRTRTTPDYVEAFTKAGGFVQEGTTVRISNRAGQNTEGTRRVNGIGTVGIKFEVHPI